MNNYTPKSHIPLTKLCKKCNCHKPATIEYFSKCSRCKDGLQRHCKKCHKLYKQQNKENAAKRNKEYVKENKKKIKEYQRQYYIDNKERIKTQRQQYYIDNKDKISILNSEYYRANKSKVQKTIKKYHVKNKEQISKKKKQWRERNKDRLKIKRKKYYLENKTRILGQIKKYKKKNKDKYRLIRHKRLARKQNLPNTFTEKQMKNMFEYFGYCCAVCGTPQDMFIKLELDHWIPLTSDQCLGTVAQNIIPLCGNKQGLDGHIGCNQSKSNSSPDEWLTKRFGKKQAKAILSRINTYFSKLGANKGEL